MKLEILEDRFAICRLSANAPLPEWAAGGSFVSVTRTSEELSIVCKESGVPADVNSERGWRCLRVAGTLDFELVGVLKSLLDPLAEAEISVFAISTFDTDYLLVRESKLEAAIKSFQSRGYDVNLSAG